MQNLIRPAAAVDGNRETEKQKRCCVEAEKNAVVSTADSNRPKHDAQAHYRSGIAIYIEKAFI